MIKATEEHHLTLNTTDEKTAGLANMIHNMGEWREMKLLSDDTFIKIHDILREAVGTKNFISVVAYADMREEYNEYRIILVEFPEESDGSIRTMVGKGENEFYLLSQEELKAHLETENTTDKKGNK